MDNLAQCRSYKLSKELHLSSRLAAASFLIAGIAQSKRKRAENSSPIPASYTPGSSSKDTEGKDTDEQLSGKGQRARAIYVEAKGFLE